MLVGQIDVLDDGLGQLLRVNVLGHRGPLLANWLGHTGGVVEVGTESVHLGDGTVQLGHHGVVHGDGTGLDQLGHGHVPFGRLQAQVEFGVIAVTISLSQSNKFDAYPVLTLTSKPTWCPAPRSRNCVHSSMSGKSSRMLDRNHFELRRNKKKTKMNE